MSEATQKPEFDATQEPNTGEAESAPQGETPPTDPGILLAETQAKAEEHRNAWLRALADADNARKRAQADVAAAHKFAIERFAQSLLPVVDSLEAALDARDADAATVRSGVELTLKQLLAALEQGQVSVVAPAAGERFDPHRHQAMAAVDAEADPNTVVTVLQKGYLLNDRVLRPALVTVAKAQPANDGA